jgi:hypothetical protein
MWQHQALGFPILTYRAIWTSISADKSVFQVASGRLYESDIHIQGNIYPNSVLLEALAGPSPGDMDENRYLIQAEARVTDPPSPPSDICVHAGMGAKIEGVGTVICNGTSLVDDNPITFTQHLRIVPADTNSAASVIGSFSNFNGTGNAAIASIGTVFQLSNPYAQFGTIHGPFVDSTYSASQGQPGNGHFFYSCPALCSGGLSGCTSVAQVLDNGVANASAGFGFNGTPGFTGTKIAGSCTFTIQGGIITNVTGC